jgi:ABC-type sugar transport system permease subunit
MSTQVAGPSAPAPGRPRPAAPGRRSPRAARENRDGLVMVLPTAVLVVAVVIVPVLWNVVLAFQRLTLVDIRDAGIFQQATLQNFARVFSSPGFWSSIATTVVYSVFATAGSILVGLLLALALRRPFRGRALFRGILLLPYVAPVVAVSFVWRVMLNPQYGVVNVWGQQLLGWDRPIDFLGRAPYALITVIGFEIWRYFPFALLFLSARLLAVPRELEEAAVMDGASLLQRYRFIVLPQLLPVIALLSVLRLIMTFNKFDDVFLLTGGGAGTQVAAVRVYDTLTGRFDVGGAAAQALVLAAILGVSLFCYMRFFVRREGA